MPSQVFGTSVFAQDSNDEGENVYARGSEIWNAMVELGKWDKSFRNFLVEQQIDPDDPVSEDVAEPRASVE